MREYNGNTFGDLEVDGSLTVSGTLTSIETTNTQITDRLIELANGASTGADSGIIIERGSTGNNAALIWDESRDEFVLCTTTATGASTGDLSFTPANLSVERIGAGTEQAQAEIHAKRDQSASGVYSTTATIISEDDARPSIQLVGSANNIGLIQFGDNAAEAAGQVYYDHSTDKLRIDCGGSADRLTVDASGNVATAGVVTATGFTIGSAAITEAELEILDGATLSTAELNYVDGVTSAIQTQLDAKGAAAGSSSIVTTGALNAGSITSGFSSIDVGSGTITTTGAVGTGALTTTVTSATGVTVDQNFSTTTASTIVGIDIDIDKTGASTTDNSIYGIRCDIDNTTATDGTNTVIGASLTPTLTHAATAGTTLVKGAEIVATGSAPGNTTTRGIDVTATGADYNQGLFMTVDNGGIDIKMVSSADAGDHCTIATGAAGATTLTTTDNGGANADLTFSIDGSFDVTATSMSLSSDLTVTGGDITLGTASDANNATIGAATESGTDTAGKSLTIGGGLGTGNAASGDVIVTVGVPGSSGSSAQSAITAQRHSASGTSTYYGGVAALANDTGVGDVVIFGTEDGTDSLSAGRLMVMNSSGVWKYADADTEALTSGLLAIALGTAVSDGLLVRGFFKLNSFIEGSHSPGQPCYVSEAAGEIDFTRPSAGSDFVRIVGHAIDTSGVIYFNPDHTWIEL